MADPIARVPAAMERDIDARLAAAGIVVPADLHAGVLSEAQDLLRMTALLRGPRSAAAEPFTIVWSALAP